MPESQEVVHHRVLIVDDISDITEMLRALVTILGHDAAIANHGDQALQVARDFHPDLVLLDLGMPDPDGYEVARRLRAEPDGHAMQLVAMSGWGHQEAREQATRAGFDRHVLKPITLSHLTALLSAPRRTR
jgi:CheY-like chemotaxis protein